MFDRLVNRFDLKSRLMPSVEGLSPKAFDKFHGLMMGFVNDAQCLDDLETLNKDGAFTAVVPSSYCAKSYGDFLRKFKSVDIKALSYKLIETSLQLRAQVPQAKDQPFIVDIDTATNEQHGLKMEGCAHDYNGTWGLSTVHAHDQFGLPFWHWVREGNTFSANGVGEVLHGAPGRAHSLGGASPLCPRQGEALAEGQGCPPRGGI